ncbi:MAG: acyltransferase [Flavobacteriales bacterium CG_4_10_14_0_2_um_filter_35_18]|nr:MAG: acyltransferase [Flavobacteriales bacterium CG_4_10_14_0_2_um_filter_35_18]
MKQRLYFVDWLRVIAFFILMLFHCAMPFVSFGWEVKNNEHSIGLTRFIWWLHQWRIPLLFFICGIGIHFSLEKRSVLTFAGERIKRLLIPLLFAMFFTIPLQVYFEFLQKGKITGSYFNFYPRVWDLIPYPDGALTWSHMWFVVYLFVFCLLLIPLFLLFKFDKLKALKAYLADKIANPITIVFLSLPLTYYYFTLYLDYPEQQSLLDDWFLFITSITLAIYGYFLAQSDKFWNTCETYRFYYLTISLFGAVVLFYYYWWDLNFPKQNDFNLYVYGFLNSIHIWFLIIAAVGFAKKHLNYSNAFLKFTNQAVYPFYILHQTIIVAVGYYIVQLNSSILLKMSLLIIITFMAIFIIYRYIIKPFKITRILYGVKLKEGHNL